MTIYRIDGTAITAHARHPGEPPEGGFLIRTRAELGRIDLPAKALIELWRGLGGEVPKGATKDRALAVKGLWAAMKTLAPDAGGDRDQADPAQPGPRPGSKLAILVARLRTEEGATIAGLAKATGWQEHTVRGAISAALKKRLGLTVTSSRSGTEDRCYRIAG